MIKMEQNTSNHPPAPQAYTHPTTGGQAPIAFNIPQMQAEGGERQRYQHKCVRGLSITLIMLGCLCFVLQFAEMFITNISGVSGAGIWAGAFFICTGALGILSTQKRTTSWIVIFLVMTVIGAVLSLAPLGAGAAGWGTGQSLHYGFYYRLHSRSYRVSYEVVSAGIALNAIMMIAAVINMILMIISAAFACHGLCPDSSTRGVLIVPGHVQYVTGPNGQQQAIIVPMPQPVPGTTQYQATIDPRMTSLMTGQQVMMTNQTSAGHSVYTQPDQHFLSTDQPQATASARLPHLPAYEPQGTPPQYEEKLPMVD